MGLGLAVPALHGDYASMVFKLKSSAPAASQGLI
ncbi:hypothetical protein FHS15_002340 [Paenibacillus castaneae]|nr:hypothetical protein [Paenibacillus castaneae]